MTEKTYMKALCLLHGFLDALNDEGIRIDDGVLEIDLSLLDTMTTEDLACEILHDIDCGNLN